MADEQNSLLWPTQIASLYGIPGDLDAPGQSVGVVAMDGGYDQPDIDQALKGMHRRALPVIPVSVNGVTTRPAAGSPADVELALDLQVLCGLIPGARILVYFVGSDIGGIADAITQAALDKTYGSNVLSISWGLREEAWTPTQLAAVDMALQKAAAAKMTVVAASGDHLATDGDVSHKLAHVWFPASHPSVFACGGTELRCRLTKNRLSRRSFWNDPRRGRALTVELVSFIPCPSINRVLIRPFRSLPKDPDAEYLTLQRQHQKLPGIASCSIERSSLGTEPAQRRLSGRR